MANILLINAHHYYPFAEGKLNNALIEQAVKLIEKKGHQTRLVHTDNEWDVETQLENHQWADRVILQSPVNWMMVPWTFKKYMDEVYTAGMGGALCNGDGRQSDTPKKGYGTGGTLTGKQYMLSLTFNAPAESFNDKNEYLFKGKSVDDLFFPMHANFQFFGMTPLPTYACFDVMKNPDTHNDMTRFTQHIDTHF